MQRKRMLPTNSMRPTNTKLLVLLTLYTSNHVKKPISVIFARRMVLTWRGIPARVITFATLIIGHCLKLILTLMHNMIMTMATSIDKIVVALVPEAAPMIDMIARIGIVKPPFAIARSKTIMLMIMGVCTLALVIIPQAILVTFTATLTMGMQPMVILTEVTILNGLFHPNNNNSMVNQIILKPVLH